MPKNKVTECCSASFIDGNHCSWCGKESDVMEQYGNDLWKYIESYFADWDRPSHLETYDVEKTVAKVYRLIKKDRQNRLDNQDEGSV